MEILNGQIDLFNFRKQPYKIHNHIRLIEMFGGIGSQAMALRDLGADFEHYRLVEWSPYSVKSYNAIHGTDFTPMDITKVHAADLGIVDTDKYTYIVTYSFPCQDLSIAGKMNGMKKGDNTRSGLLWEVQRILDECDELPNILVMENVTQVHGTRNREDFESWIKFLEGKGYSCRWFDMNAKRYGVAQNRDRCFMVSILGEYTYEPPAPIELTKCMKDYLEDEVDEKYFISSNRAEHLIDRLVDDGTLEKIGGVRTQST